MALAYKYRIPYKTKKEKEEADLFLKLENKFSDVNNSETHINS